LSVCDEKVVQVVDRSLFEHNGWGSAPTGDWIAVREPDGAIKYIPNQSSACQELPTPPSVVALAAKGYKLTGAAANVSGGGNSLFFATALTGKVKSNDSANPDVLGGYRWLVEAIATSPKFATGTYVVVKSSGNIYQVVDRGTYAQPRNAPNDWCMCVDVDGDDYWMTDDWSDVQKIDVMPNKAGLKAKGYKLTMQAADCNACGYRMSYVGQPSYGDVAVNLEAGYVHNCGWRWLVEKIEQPPKFATGTFLVKKTSGSIWEVVDRVLYTGGDEPKGDNWCAIRCEDGRIGWIGGVNQTWETIQELPKKPSEGFLADRGYVLTGKAADCNVTGHRNMWVTSIMFLVSDAGQYSDNDYAGYRWLIEAIPVTQDRDCNDCRNYESRTNLRQAR
jgi:hypothetical protein